MTTTEPTCAVEAVALCVRRLSGAAQFFTDVLDFDPARSMPNGPSRVRLGTETVELVAGTGRAASADSRGNDLWFQHLAIVVSDLDAATARFGAHGVELISEAPQTLPDWNPTAGGIRAVYFRGPDGHPLELIWYPPGKGDDRWQSRDRLFLGIDHTAIVVSSTEASLRFYRDGLGLDVVGAGENWGPEQERLSGVPGARVRITSLRGSSGPGVEFLDYLAPATGRPRPGGTAADLWYAETRCTTDDLDGVLRRMAAAIPGIDLSARGDDDVVIADPDGHAVRIRQTSRETFSPE
jgi:catechol 2,3-dioxygenase-like lactoylglutathione lyase family enzyme